MEIGIGYEQFQLILYQQLFKDLCHLHEEWIGEVRNNRTINLALAVLETSCAAIGNKL